MPRTYPFMQVDAFTTRPLSGNACAIVFDADELDTATMQAIAREHESLGNEFRPAPERPVQGRFPRALFHAGRGNPARGSSRPSPRGSRSWTAAGSSCDADRDRTTIALELNVGPIRVDIVHSAHGRSGVAEVAMYQMQPEFRATYPADRRRADLRPHARPTSCPTCPCKPSAPAPRN